MALYNMCDEDTAELFDHGKGHTVPRDATTIKELCDAIGRLVEKKETWQGKLNLTSDVRSDNPQLVDRIVEQVDKDSGIMAITLPS